MKDGKLTSRRHPAGSSSASSTPNMRVASAKPTSFSQQPARMSIDDVYQMAEKTRMRTSLESRQQVLVQMQKMSSNRRSRGPAIVDAVDIGVESPGFVTEVSVTLLTSPVIHPSSPYALKSGGRRRSVNNSANSHTSISANKNNNNSNVVNHGSNIASSCSINNNFGVDSQSAVGSICGNNRLDSAVTVNSSYMGSELGCPTPRPDSEGRSLSLSRQCCEVMGPGICRECRKLRVRMMDHERMEANFPRLRVCEKNITTSAVLKRVLPGMTQAEIQDKVARGEIARTSLLFPRRSCSGSVHSHPGDGDDKADDDNDKENDGYDAMMIKHNGLLGAWERYDDHKSDAGSDERGSSQGDGDERSSPIGSSFRYDNGRMRRSPVGGESTSSSITINGPNTTNNRNQHSGEGKHTINSMLMLAKLKMKLGGEASTPLFFMDLKHMNSKIFQGRVARSVKTDKPNADMTRLHPLGMVGREEEGLQHSFVSPRKVKMIDHEPAYKVYFAPPLLAKHKQVSNPSFFAGSDDPYSLPERLPEVLTFADGKMSITDPSAALNMPESSLSFAGDNGPTGGEFHNAAYSSSLTGLESVLEANHEQL